MTSWNAFKMFPADIPLGCDILDKILLYFLSGKVLCPIFCEDNYIILLFFDVLCHHYFIVRISCWVWWKLLLPMGGNMIFFVVFYFTDKPYLIFLNSFSVLFCLPKRWRKDNQMKTQNPTPKDSLYRFQEERSKWSILIHQDWHLTCCLLILLLRT